MKWRSKGDLNQGIMSGISRREAMQKLLAGIAAGAVVPAIAGARPVELYRRLTEHDAGISGGEAALGGADWHPIFLNAKQDELLVAVSETMVPGSNGAQVNQFIDLLLSVDSAESQKGFLLSLGAADTESMGQFQKSFTELNAGEREKAITSLSQDHKEAFANLKEWIVGAYYSSEQGMKELGWDGNFAFERYPTCEAVGKHS
ncbi:MAG TPA: gluconate 2-dehydrogenase subunit 3 family protein [Candidatus Eremiobacteraceae bacterium]|jgi:hypothetical protein|nr:gluconate 2-dehydrogenase subunit 3 family protein [Candidatus Eremiobacteraceae bacterium]